MELKMKKPDQVTHWSGSGSINRKRLFNEFGKAQDMDEKNQPYPV